MPGDGTDAGALAILESLSEAALAVVNKQLTQFEVVDSVLHGNVAVDGNGGAVAMLARSDTPLRRRHALWCDPERGDPSLPPIYRTWEAATRVEMRNVSIQDNQAQCEQCTGGGLDLSNGYTLLSDCTVSNNTAGSAAGGIMFGPGTGSATLVRTVVHGNAAPTGRHLVSEAAGNLSFVGSSLGVQTVAAGGRSQAQSGSSQSELYVPKHKAAWRASAPL